MNKSTITSMTLSLFIWCSVNGQTSGKEDNGGGKKKSPEAQFSVIVGLGAGSMINTTYLDPKVSKLNNAVIIEKAERMRYNATIGFSWTPYKHYIKYLDANGDVESTELVSKGWTFAAFVNPLSLTTVTETKSAFDWGAGLGWRFKAVSLLATIEFLNIRQPRDYFMTEFQGKNKPLVLNENIQTEISTSDDTIFKNRGVAAIGMKLVIPLDILKSSFGENNGGSKKDD